LRKNRKRNGKGKIHETDFNDDRLVADIIEQTGTKRTRASGRLMKLKEANGMYVVDKFDAKKMEIKLAEGSLKITKNLISEMLGIQNEGIDIMAEEGNRNEEMMAYVDGSKCSSFNVIHNRPPTLVWISKLLREREDEELNSRGFGFGEIEGPFVEQEDPMPDNIELEGFFERYVDALKYQGCRKEGSGNANISDANRAADGQNNEGASFVSIQAMIGERVISLRDKHADIGMDQEGTVDDNILGSPTLYNMGPKTQQEFSLGVTQDFAHLDEDVVTPEANTHEQNLASEISNPLPLRPIPLRVFPPGTAVGRLRRDKDKRPVTIFEVRKSPFIGRVVDADGLLNATEKRVTKYLFEVLEDHR
nr:C2 calcium-dependent membrane targeting [Tanacetum cinerariifolium]